MKNCSLTAALMVVAALLVNSPLQAEVTLPADNEKEKWHEFINTFAECSAVYNLAATIKERPDKGAATTYRELANNALISGMMSAEKSGLHDDYLESIYSVKLGLWQAAAKDKAQQAGLLGKADSCIAESLPYQSAIIANLRSHTAKQ